MPSDLTSPALRFLDAGPGGTAARTLAGQGVRPEELLAVEVFYDPAQLNADQARESVRELNPDGTLPVSAIPASVGMIGEGPVRVQATALPAGATATHEPGGRYASGASAVATRLLTAPEAGDIVAQSHAVLQAVKELLAAEGLDLDDVAKFNIFYCGEGTQEDWAVAARVRAGYFTEPGPATTGIPVPRFDDPDVLIAMQVLALRDARPSRRHSWPHGHWDWPFHLPYKHGNRSGGMSFIGGQVPLDEQARPLDVGDFPAQVRRSLDYIARVLDELDVPRSAVRRLTAFVAADAGSGPAKLAALRSEVGAFFGGSSPALVPVPLPVLAYPDMDVEIEVQALID
ncbi:RidA family protein [Nonomuraea sp. NPDC049649]|uniref:RidA family protein n=1 Tax=Nonomuraea sp. NPDC049649 TaxID=3155776 RepID=UPI003426CFDE